MRNIFKTVMLLRGKRQARRSRMLERKLINDSGLFDAQWYTGHYPDVGQSGSDPLEHFLLHGGHEQRRPSRSFDLKAYIALHPEAVDGKTNPLLHYIRRRAANDAKVTSGHAVDHSLPGSAEIMDRFGIETRGGVSRARLVDTPPPAQLRAKLTASALFDPKWYCERYLDGAAGEHHAIDHFLASHHLNIHSPGPYFDPQAYLQMYPDLAAGRVHAFAHYLIKGANEGREPNPFFDAAWYREKNSDVAGDGADPIDHYILYGDRENRSPSSRFDPVYYVDTHPDVAASGLGALAHFMSFGRSVGRSPLAKAKTPGGPDIAFSIVVIDGSRTDVDATLSSIAAQSRSRFEVLLLSDKPQEGDRPAQSWPITPWMGRADIRRITASSVGDAVAHAISSARHAYLVVLDAGDRLARNALETVCDVIGETEADIVYTNESVREARTGVTREVSKPGWSPELLTARNYFGRFSALRTQIARRSIPAASAGTAWEWDLNLRVADQSTQVRRIPQTLCLRRAVDPAVRSSGLERFHRDAASVLTQYWSRRGIDVRVRPGAIDTFHTDWIVKDQPLVSIIIPTRRRAASVQRLAEQLVDTTTYENVEVIIVAAGLDDVEATEFAAGAKSRPVRVVCLRDEFQQFRACNFGAASARGSLLLFLDDAVETTQPHWLGELVMRLLQPGVGIVGPKLVRSGDRALHSTTAPAPSGPERSAQVLRNVMAVPGACQLVRANVFELVGGYEERFTAVYGDIALCLDASRFGYRTVHAPDAEVALKGEGVREDEGGADLLLLAERLRTLGLSDDPDLHSAFEVFPGGSVPPEIEAPMSGRGRLQWAVGQVAGRAEPSGILDLFDDGAVAAAVGRPWASILRPFDPRMLEPSVQSGARVVIELIRRRRDLRTRFPRALRDGSSGAFASWVKTEGLRLLEIDAEFSVWIDAAFEAKLSAPARQHLVYNHGLRAEQPLFLVPDGRVASCRYLFWASDRGAVSFEGIWWFLLECAEEPLAELLATWAITPLWQQAVPTGGTIFGITQLVRWVSETYGVTQDWIFAQRDPSIMSAADQVRLAFSLNDPWREAYPNALDDLTRANALLEHLRTRASGLCVRARTWMDQQDRPGLARRIAGPGVTILGHFSYPSGLRISAESIVEGLRANDLDVSLRDVPVMLTNDEAIGTRFSGVETFDTTIVHVQPVPFFHEAFERSGLHPRSRSTYRIAYWYWELDSVPSSWDRAALDCDEIWTATDFVAEGLRARYQQPVHVLPPGIEIADFDRRQRSDFKLEEAPFVFLFMFHMSSIMDRKNPFGLIRAFKAAFAGVEDVLLVIKTCFGDQHRESFERLCEAAQDDKIRIIDGCYTRDDTLSLIAASDAYVSLHRSEGLGLTMAEAMLLARPVIATRYSGNLSFMDDDNALLVDHRLVTLDRDDPPYLAGQRWAEPSVAHASTLMRRLYDDRPFARALGERAQADLRRRLNYAVTGQAMAARLKDIARMP